MRFPTDVNYLCALDVIDELSQDIYELSHEDELLTMLTKALDQFVFQNMSHHVDDIVVDSWESLSELYVINIPKKLELPEIHTKLLPSRIHPLN